jgi:peptidoglycan/LPS O-acetylase OafA/YrhL
MFPLIIRKLLYGRWEFAVAGGSLCVAALVTIFVADWSFDTIGAMGRCICGFVLGVLAYRMRLSGSFARVLDSHTVPSVLLIAILGLLCTQNAIAAVLACPILILALSYERGIAPLILGSKPAYMLGVWSYSIYLIHPLWIPFRRQLAGLFAGAYIPGAAAIATIATLIVVVTLSCFCHKGVENPGRKLFQRLFKPYASVQIAPNQYQAKK